MSVILLSKLFHITWFIRHITSEKRLAITSFNVKLIKMWKIDRENSFLNSFFVK